MDYLSLRFTGNGVAPSNTRCRELAALISATEGLISAMMQEEDGDETVSLSLVSLEDQSVGLKFAAVQIAIALTIWQDFAAIVSSKQFAKLPPRARDRFAEIVSFVKKKGCSAVIGDSQKGTTAAFSSDISLPANAKFKGRTTLLGEVVGVGGKDPKVRLKLASGAVLSCDSSEAVAKKLGHRLYELVTCRGLATWDYASGAVIKFKIEEVGSFQKASASAAFEELAQSMPNTLSRWTSSGLAAVLEEIGS